MCEAINRREVETEVERLWNLPERPLVDSIRMEIRAQFTDNPYQKWAIQRLNELIAQEYNQNPWL